jgi:hypothetical protein
MHHPEPRDPDSKLTREGLQQDAIMMGFVLLDHPATLRHAIGDRHGDLGQRRQFGSIPPRNTPER